MAADDDDWRIAGQERWLAGRHLVWRQWAPYRPEWDHDHCEFCTRTFGPHAASYTERTEGWVTDDGHWVCDQCFRDFVGRFAWSTSGAPDSG